MSSPAVLDPHRQRIALSGRAATQHVGENTSERASPPPQELVEQLARAPDGMPARPPGAGRLAHEHEVARRCRPRTRPGRVLASPCSACMRAPRVDAVSSAAAGAPSCHAIVAQRGRDRTGRRPLPPAGYPLGRGGANRSHINPPTGTSWRLDRHDDQQPSFACSAVILPRSPRDRRFRPDVHGAAGAFEPPQSTVRMSPAPRRTPSRQAVSCAVRGPTAHIAAAAAVLPAVTAARRPPSAAPRSSRWPRTNPLAAPYDRHRRGAASPAPPRHRGHDRPASGLLHTLATALAMLPSTSRPTAPLPRRRLDRLDSLTSGPRRTPRPHRASSASPRGACAATSQLAALRRACADRPIARVDEATVARQRAPSSERLPTTFFCRALRRADGRTRRLAATWTQMRTCAATA